jgi:hypothetical protein
MRREHTALAFLKGSSKRHHQLGQSPASVAVRSQQKGDAAMKPLHLLLPLAFAATVGIALAPAQAEEHAGAAKHVIVISVDGLHQTDLTAYVSSHPNSTLARFAGEGAAYSNARTPFPSDSFPGLTAIVTGGNPRSAGIYYDDTWNRALLPAGTTKCAGVAPGVEVTYFEQLDKNLNSIDAGEGVGDLSTHAKIQQNIYKMSKQGRDGIDPTQLPVDPSSCLPIYPHTYLRVNTVFEVAKAHGLHTAWSDKHLAYELVNGPSGSGVDDLFAPEINSLVPDGTGNDWTADNLNTQFYDALKVQAVINWAKGGNHDGTPNLAGAPALYGMNFQTVSTAEKLNITHYAGIRDANGVPTFDSTEQPAGASKGLGGYSNAGTLAGPVLEGALDFVDGQLGRIVAAVDPKNTVIIVSAKHGQSPLDRLQLRLIDDGEVISAVNAAWAKVDPANASLVSFGIDDDGMLLWLSDRSERAANFVRSFLWNYVPLKTGGSDANGNFVNYDGTVQHSGLRAILAGIEASHFIGVPHDDDRVPDVIGIAAVGTVYSNPTKIKKIAEHGGDAIGDRHVPILVWGAGVDRIQVADQVETTQIAPTVLKALGLNPGALQAVQKEGTETLPGVFHGDQGQDQNRD